MRKFLVLGKYTSKDFHLGRYIYDTLHIDLKLKYTIGKGLPVPIFRFPMEIQEVQMSLFGTLKKC